TANTIHESSAIRCECKANSVAAGCPTPESLVLDARRFLRAVGWQARHELSAAPSGALYINPAPEARCEVSPARPGSPARPAFGVLGRGQSPVNEANTSRVPLGTAY